MKMKTVPEEIAGQIFMVRVLIESVPEQYVERRKHFKRIHELLEEQMLSPIEVGMTSEEIRDLAKAQKPQKEIKRFEKRKEDL